jgi:L-ascorbate metabolism protein UlaG (beta-lactamase superfamily)
MAFGRDTTFTWYGHSCFEVRTTGGKVILIDPWFGNPRSPKTADAVDACDVMLVTHGHGDHLGEAVALASRLGPAWPCIHEMSLWLARRLAGGADATLGFNKGGTVEVAGIKVTMVGADHSSGDWNAAADTTVYLGEPAGFVVQLENGFTFYHAGDTNVFTDMALVGELYKPDVALLPIGGHFTMGPREAALAVQLLGTQHVIPMHYGTFPILSGTVDEFRAALEARELGEVEIHSPDPGGTVD